MRPVYRVMMIFIALCLSAPAVSFSEARSIVQHGEGMVQAAGSGSADPRLDQRSTGFFHIVPAASTRSLDGDELLKIGDLHEVQGHLLEAMPYYRRALSVFRTKKDQRGTATALVRIGRIQERQERYAEAYASLQESMPLLVAMEDVPRARSFMTLGRIAEALGKAGEAQSAYEQAKTLFQQAQDRPGFSESLIRLGSLLIAQGRAKDGLADLKAALKDAGERGDHVQEVMVLTLMGDSHLRDGERGEARVLYEEGLKLAEAQQDAKAEAGFRARLAWLYETAGQSAEGAKSAWRALALYQSLRDRSQEADTWSLLGNLHQHEGNLTLALEYHGRALGLYRALRDSVREAGSLVNLAVVYETQGSQQEATETQQKALALLQAPSHQ